MGCRSLEASIHLTASHIIFLGWVFHFNIDDSEYFQHGDLEGLQPLLHLNSESDYLSNPCNDIGQN